MPLASSLIVQEASMRRIKLILMALALLALCACAGAEIKNTSSAAGQTAYDFSLPDQDGKMWKLSDTVKEYRAVVLAFYPKDDTGV
jgi:cytochrome oxidase Cu insertion factor (SCO1/SenC/PrrC family)